MDYRGAFLADPNLCLGLRNIKDVYEQKPDIVLFEMQKEIGLALKSNCNVLEHINSKPIYRTPEYLDMKRLVNNAMHKKGVYNSYRGMATFNFKKFILGGKANVKKYLYVFRSLMAGTYALQTGRIEPNINKLNARFKIKEVKELVRLKKSGELTEVVDIDTGVLDEKIGELFVKIDEAYVKTKIPEKTSEEDFKALNSFLIQTRKEMIPDLY